MWEKVNNALKQKINTAQHSIYIACLQHEFKDGAHIVYAPNEIVSNHVIKHYITEIDALLNAERPGHVSIVVGTKVSKKAVNGENKKNSNVVSIVSSTNANGHVKKTKDLSVLEEQKNYVELEFLADIGSYNFKDLAFSISEATYLPPHTVFMVGLSIFSSMSCRKFCAVYPDGKRLPIGMYVIAEQPSGSSKSRCMELFQRPFFNVHAEAVEQYKQKLTNCSELDAKPKPVPRFFITNATPESIEETLDKTSGYFSLVSSEKGLLDTLFGGMYLKTGQSNNNDLVLNGYVGDYVSSLRISREGFTGYACGAVSAFVQDGAVQQLLGVSNGSGLAERFILMCEPHALGTRNHEQYTAINSSYTGYLQTANVLAEQIVSSQELLTQLRTVTLCKQGWAAIRAYRNKIEPNLADGGLYSHVAIRGMAGKIDIAIIKIAVNLFLVEELENSCNGFGELTVPIQYVKDVILIAHEVLEKTIRLCGAKELFGDKAAYMAIIRMFETSSVPLINEQKIVSSRSYVAPFKDATSNRSKAVREALKQMVNAGILVKDKDINGIVAYRLG